MKEFFKHNRVAAFAALLVIIALSLTLGVNRSVGKLANELASIYTSGSAEYGSAEKDVKKFCTYFNELYGLITSDSISRPAYSADLSRMISSPFCNANLLSKAYADASADYNRFINTPGIDDSVRNEAIRSFAELKAIQLRIKNNLIYNTAAEEYNKALAAFPASILDFLHSPAAVFD